MFFFPKKKFFFPKIQFPKKKFFFPKKKFFFPKKTFFFQKFLHTILHSRNSKLISQVWLILSTLMKKWRNLPVGCRWPWELKQFCEFWNSSYWKLPADCRSYCLKKMGHFRRPSAAYSAPCSSKNLTNKLLQALQGLGGLGCFYRGWSGMSRSQSHLHTTGQFLPLCH